MWWYSWLRYWATNQKVAGSIPSLFLVVIQNGCVVKHSFELASQQIVVCLLTYSVEWGSSEGKITPG